ncbi:GntR family transcriptional regulator [Spirillospora sp. CA-108201]
MKYKEVAGALAQEIQRGDFVRDSRLPGEHELARRFDVSRGTIRQALASLQQDGLIETWPGAGSFVTYDGRPLDERLGWSRALATRGVPTTAEVIRLARVMDPGLARELGLTDAAFLAVDRVRRLVAETSEEPRAIAPAGDGDRTAGLALSYERSRLPWRAGFAGVVERGLSDGSLSRTLAELGIQGSGGREIVSVGELTGEAGELLGRPPGTAFLNVTRTVRDQTGAIVEHVSSLLDPHHFRLELRFGEADR